MRRSKWLSFLLVATWNVILVSSAPTLKADDFSFVILHNNDMHGRFEETESNTGSCQKGHRNNTCIGKYRVYVSREFKKIISEKPVKSEKHVSRHLKGHSFFQ